MPFVLLLVSTIAKVPCRPAGQLKLQRIPHAPETLIGIFLGRDAPDPA